MAHSPASDAVCFLFTDIEGSTRRWEHLPDQMAVALARHDVLLRDAIETHHGHVFKTIGDAFCAVFDTAPDAVAAALAGQHALAREEWGAVGAVRVRMALHTGPVQRRDDDFFGPTVNRVARLLSAGYGDQILLSQAMATALGPALPADVELRDLGEHRLKDLLTAERVYQLIDRALPDAFPPIKTLDRRRHNLPEQPTALIGREKEIAEARTLLGGGARLVTLTGPGGVGKTRLGLQVAAELVDGFPDGVWFVPLAPLQNAESVLPAIGAVLGVRDEGGVPLHDRLHEELHDKQLLLLLDNFEHVTAAAPLLGPLIAAGAGVRVLATSRATLRVYGERELSVPPLPLPDPRALPPLAELREIESIRLFTERAQAVTRDFALTDQNGSIVAAICAKLDGLPLAIELAAARSKILSPAALLGRLERRLAVLTGGGIDRDPRQQTLRGAIAWSYDLLTPDEQTLFQCVSVFSGGFSLEAVEAVAGKGGEGGTDEGGEGGKGGRGGNENAIPPHPLQPPLPPFLDGIASLVDKSLLRQEELATGEPRFVMLETIREFGLERLEESGALPAVRNRHAGYFRALIEQADESLTGERQGETLDRLEREIDNIRAAMTWLLEHGHAGQVLTLARPLRHMADRRGYLHEVRRWLERALSDADDAPADARAHALNDLANISSNLADFLSARSHYEASLRLWVDLDHRVNIAVVSYGLGIVAREQGDYADARTRFEKALAVFRELGDQEAEAFTLDQLGDIARFQGRIADARTLHETALAVVETLGDPAALAHSYHALGRVALHEHEEAAAKRYLDESLQLYDALADRFGLATVHHTLGSLAWLQRNVEEAASRYLQSLALWHEIEDRFGVVECLEGLASVYLHNADPIRAARVLACATRQRELVNVPVPPSHQADHEKLLAEIRASLDEISLRQAWALGERIALHDVVAEVLQDVAPSAPASG